MERSTLLGNLQPLADALQNWTPEPEALEFYGSKEVCFLSEPNFEALTLDTAAERENLGWSVGFFHGAAAALDVTVAQFCEQHGLPGQ